MKRILFLMPLLGLVLLSSCRGKETVVAVTGVDLSERSLTLQTGDERLLTATVRPHDAANPQVSWSSSNPSVATVTEGLVKALAEGTASITVKTVDGGFTDSALITVVARPVPVTGVSIQGDAEITLTKDATLQLTAVVAPADATHPEIIWSSSDPAVATVSETGLVKALSEGTSTITVKTVEGSFSASVKVNVTIPTTDIGTGSGFTENDYGEYN